MGARSRTEFIGTCQLIDYHAITNDTPAVLFRIAMNNIEFIKSETTIAHVVFARP